jgi:ArsR family transcriptional regulator, arsenate/arsenite/antimonite-responsive transcriptional repressor
MRGLTLLLRFDISGTMDMSQAMEALGALAQESRLKVFRLLVRQGPAGMAAGDIARSLGVPPNTLSSHLGILSRGGLIASRKEGRSIIYAMDVAGTRALLSFLIEDCCRAAPNVCDQLLRSALAECCPEEAGSPSVAPKGDRRDEGRQ